MRLSHLRYLVCPECTASLTITAASTQRGGRILEGELECISCAARFPICRGIPRFVPGDNYAEAFGFQWKRHSRTQHDDHSASSISGDRFFSETKWDTDLQGETILEVGCGSGRFTGHALSTGAMVIATDMSAAVEETARAHGHAENLLVVQSDLYRMPFARRSFDKIFCFGVLQHTPDVEGAFKALPEFLARDGRLAVDVYDKNSGIRSALELLRTHMWIRPLTRRLPPRLLYRLVAGYITSMWPIARIINRIPRIGRQINRALLVVDYRGRYPLSDEMLKEWSILDTFDMLSPAFEQRQTIGTVRRWFDEAPLRDIEVDYGYNGIEGRAVRS